MLTDNCCHGLEQVGIADATLRRVIERPVPGWPDEYTHPSDDELDDPDHERFVQALVIDS